MPTFHLKEKDEGKLAKAVNATAAAVKKKYGESNRLVDYLNKKHNEKDQYVLKIFWENDDTDKMWEYVRKFQIGMPYKGMSDIKAYTNKRGKTSMAHYNGSKFMCLVGKDKKPITCVKWAVPTIDEWKIDSLGKFIKNKV